MSADTLVVQELSVALGGTEIISDISVSVESGELLGIVGPNGAGKTTLIRAIQCTLPATQGSVTVEGQPVERLSARERGRLIASVPQETRLSFSFTVEHAVAMGRNPHIGRFGTADETDHQAVQRALEQTQLTEFADRQVTELSGGERQRVLLARAFAQDAPLLLLDEPTANLDINHAINTLDLVRTVVDEGTAAVAAIHDLDLAARYCDRLLLIADGELLAVGSPESVLTSHRLKAAFDVETVVSEDAATNSPHVTALSSSDSDRC